jgi:hypothetical protein
MAKIKFIAPEAATDEMRAAAGDIEFIGRLYVLRVPEHSSEEQRTIAAGTLFDVLKGAHADGSPYGAIVLPDGWRIEACDVEP